MRNMAVIMAVLTVILVIIGIGMPFLSMDNNKGRMKALQRKREELRRSANSSAVVRNSFRDSMMKETFTQKWAAKLNLMRFVNVESTRMKLVAAGWRGRATLSAYLLVHLLLPVGLSIYAAFMIYGGPLSSTFSSMTKPLVIAGVLVVGFFIPSTLMKNAMQKRITKLSRQFPDALDLLLVCVEAGLSMDLALIRVTEEIGQTVPEVAEEFAITAAELAYLGDRHKAFDNMSGRTGNPDFKALATVLIQAERQGAPIADAIRTISAEARMNRVNMIEKKAAGLGPKMTVPMILFILPCMFLILIGPSVIKIMAMP